MSHWAYVESDGQMMFDIEDISAVVPSNGLADDMTHIVYHKYYHTIPVSTKVADLLMMALRASRNMHYIDDVDDPHA